MSIVISIINEAGLPDDEVKAYVAAQQIQVSRDFAPDWKRDAKIVFGPVAGSWPVYLRNTIDVENALGYHSAIGSEGQAPDPFSIVCVALDRKYGLAWTVTASHEVLEMLGDPTANLVRPYPGGKHVAYEACDPVEADKLGYKINDVLLSNFVLQAWFTGKGKRYDFTNALKAPLSLAPGGYIAVEKGGKWTQVVKKADAGTVSRIMTSSRHPGRMGFGSV